MAIHKHDNQSILDQIISLPPISTDHNLLTNLQGGDSLATIPTYYHLSASEHNTLTLGGDATLLHDHYTEGIFLHGVNVDPAYDITLENVISYMWSSGEIFGFGITDNGDGTINLAYGVVMLRTSDTMSPYFSDLVSCKVNAQTNIALTDNVTNYVYAYYNGGSPTIAVSTDITTIHATDKVLLYVITRVGTHLDYIHVGRYQSDFMAKYAKKIVARNGGAEYAYGCITSEVDTRKLVVTSGAYYYINEQIITPAFNTNVSDTFTYIYRAATPGTYTRVTGQTTIDNLQYDDGDGTLGTLSGGNYGVHWVFLVLDAPTRLIVVYGQSDYANVSAAEAAGIPTDLPPEVRTYSTGVLIAKIIVKKSATNLYSVQNPFTTRFTSSVATMHNGLAGLQGGTTDEYYHLTLTDYNSIASGSLINSAVILAPAASTRNVIQPTGAAIIPLIIKGASAQSANFQEWQSSGGAVFASMSAGGTFTAAKVIGVASSAGNTPLVAKGASGQTGNLMQWQNSSASVLSFVDASGGFGINTTTKGTVAKLAINSAITADNSACVQITTTADTNKPLVVQRFSATQSANLTEWQTSAGTVLSAVDPSGVFLGPELQALTGSGVAVTGRMTTANGASVQINNSSTRSRYQTGSLVSCAQIQQNWVPSGTGTCPDYHVYLLGTINAGVNATGISCGIRDELAITACSDHRCINWTTNLSGVRTAARGIYSELTFAPTSGTCTYTGIELASTINQTGGASGITRGLYINPTLTAVADYRAIEVAASKFVVDITGGMTTAGKRVIGVNSVVTASGTTVGATADHVVIFTGALTQIYTLPACTTGRQLIIKNRSTGDVTVNRAGSDTIDGLTSVTLTENDSVTLIGNGTDWSVV